MGQRHRNGSNFAKGSCRSGVCNPAKDRKIDEKISINVGTTLVEGTVKALLGGGG